MQVRDKACLVHKVACFEIRNKRSTQSCSCVFWVMLSLLPALELLHSFGRANGSVSTLSAFM